MRLSVQEWFILGVIQDFTVNQTCSKQNTKSCLGFVSSLPLVYLKVYEMVSQHSKGLCYPISFSAHKYLLFTRVNNCIGLLSFPVNMLFLYYCPDSGIYRFSIHYHCSYSSITFALITFLKFP